MKLRRLPVYELNAQGKQTKRLSKKWYDIFVAFDGQLRRLPLLPDKRASKELARTVDQLNSQRSGGGVLPPDLARAVEDMPAAIRKRLAQWDIISATKFASSKPLFEHLAEWKAAIMAKGSTRDHAERSANRVLRIIKGCGFIMLSDVSASAVQRFIASLREDRRDVAGNVSRGISPTTFNHYLTAARGFFAWMVQDRRCHENPLIHLVRVNARADRRHDRRALSVNELRRLIDTTKNGRTMPSENGKPALTISAIERFGMSGADRALLYQLASETGLRAGELRSLTRASFDLAGDEPSVTIAAAYAKNRRQDMLPLKRGTAAALAAHMAGKMPTAAAFAMPPQENVIDAFRADLSDARRAWLESCQSKAERLKAEGTTFLAYVDDAGRYADFHALRHTFISNLAAGGVHPKTAQRLARHSAITLTMDRYTHLHADDMAVALDALPDLSGPACQTASSTGTYDGAAVAGNSVSPSLSPNGAIQGNSVQLAAINMAMSVNAGSSVKQGENTILPDDPSIGSARIRTENQGIMSPLL